MIFEPWGRGRARRRSTSCGPSSRPGPPSSPATSSASRQTRTGGLRWPRWERDDRFDIARHVVRAALPEPKGEAGAPGVGGRVLLPAARPRQAAVGDGDPATSPTAAGRWSRRHITAWSTGSARWTWSTRCSTRARTRTSGPTGPPGRRRARLGRVQRRPPGFRCEPPCGWRPRASTRPATCSSAGGSAVGSRPVGSPAPLRGPHHAAEALSRARALVEVLVKDELIAAPRTQPQRADRDAPQPRGADRAPGRAEGDQAKPRRQRQRRRARGDRRGAAGAASKPRRGAPRGRGFGPWCR